MTVADLCKCGQIVVAPRFEQGFLGQCAGGDQPHDIAFDHGFIAAFFRLRRAFHLFADRHAEALADQRQQIPFGGMHRNAAHGDVFAPVFAAFGQRDIQRFSGMDGIVKEHLVEIAHAVEQQRFGVLGFQL